MPARQETPEIRNFFMDPADPNAEQLAQLGADTIRAMAQIYAFGGRIDRMSPEIRTWLESSLRQTPADSRNVIGKVLYNEAGTRRFDANFMGQIHPQGNQVGIIAHLIAAYMNTNTIVEEVSMAENRMEGEVLEWWANAFGYDKNCFSGNIVTGGTTANLAALWVAREKKEKELKEKGEWKRGLPLYVLKTKRAHYSITKACRILGLIPVNVPTDRFKTDPKKMERIVERMEATNNAHQIVAVLGLAGQTETGLIDDMSALSSIAKRHHLYLHVDAAYGGPFILSRAGKLLEGINEADSIATDPHKMLYVPYHAGMVLFRDKNTHYLVNKDAIENATYLPIREAYGATRVEGSMGSGGVIATWATMQLLGREGLSQILDHTLDLARCAYERVSANASAILRPLHLQETNTVLIGLSEALKAKLTQTKHDYVLSTAKERLDLSHHVYFGFDKEIDDGRAVLRFVGMHPYTTEQQVVNAITLLEQEIQKLLPSYYFS